MSGRTTFLLLSFITIVLTVFALPKTTLRLPNKQLGFLPKSITLGKDIKLGLDLAGGSRLVFSADVSKVKKTEQKEVLEAARSAVERRANFFGVNETSVTLLSSGSLHKIAIEIPGIKDPKKAVSEIEKAAELDFREYALITVKEGTQSAQAATFKKTKLNGSLLSKTQVVFDQQNGGAQVGITFNKEGKKLFGQLTKKNIGKPLGIFLDGQLLTAPVVQQEINTGEAVITGNFTTEEAQSLVKSLKAGSIPVPIRLIEQKTVEPTLGSANIRQSLVAGVVGLFCLFLFMLVLYRVSGVVAIISLLVYALYSLALYKMLGIVLTLSGIAGFILSIGMAVDSNILIYERIKEEKLRQIDPARAVRIGFFRALTAIREANINTLLICFILFNPLNWSFFPQFGAVRGFALTLALGVLLSLFTGVFITKNILWRIYKITK